jgi:26S proteasome regulatory subunit N3
MEVTMNEEKQSKTTEQEEKDVNLISIDDLKGHIRFIEKAVLTKEARYVSRVLRALSSTRKKLNHVVLWRIVSMYFPLASADKDFLLSFLDEPMETECVVPIRPRSSRGGSSGPLPEVTLYLHLLVVIHLIDTQRNTDAVKCVDTLIEKVQSLSSRRSSYELSAKCYFYYGRAYELVERLHEIRSFLHSRLRTASLRHDIDGQATLLNLLLRNYLHYNLYDQAFKLHSKADFPESASNNEWARYLYYLGRIQAIQLDYSSAQRNLVQAIRKAPQQSAIGFKQMATKLSVTVQLLLGEIPDRSVFREPVLWKPLQSYLQLVQAVCTGDLSKFAAVVEEYCQQFKKDHTYTLILR